MYMHAVSRGPCRVSAHAPIKAFDHVMVAELELSWWSLSSLALTQLDYIWVEKLKTLSEIRYSATRDHILTQKALIFDMS